ncbi:MAG: malonyl-[acyl-carrier protein] O-methyltransferase BioC [Gammaproteobacteria bacterium]|nr:MAG: malonyl-[acyl-carrier protein] O-methyltransferase BioC [Gammaproteobacteria bacterium]
MNDDWPTLDRRAVVRSFDAVAERYDQHAVLQQEIGRRLLERLGWLKITPEIILDLGAGTGDQALALIKYYRHARVIAMDLSQKMLLQTRRRKYWMRRPSVVCGDAHQIPVADTSVDMVFSSVALQWCEGLDRVFAEVRRVLKPGGVFLFSTFGPDTLKELRASWASVDNHAHIHPFMDMHDIGDLLLQSGLAEPVMDREELTLTYETVREVMLDLKHIGANNAIQTRSRGLLGKKRYQSLVSAYEVWRQDGRLPATYEVIYGNAWGSETRQKGSAVTVPVSSITK